MSEMVERVARAIAGNVSQQLWDKLHPVDRDDALHDARRAIAAMLEPTPGMVDAANEADTDGPASYTHVYRAMLTAALQESV